MEYRKFGKLDFEVSKVGLGTWVTGGWMWGGSSDEESVAAITAAIESGVTLIDTAPVYGFGHSETIVGNVVSQLKARDKVILATKCGLEWNDSNRERIRRNSSRDRILKEIDESRKRLQTDVIDIYQVHWPDEAVSFAETMETLLGLLEKGVIRAIGVSNFTIDQMKECMKHAPLHSLQPPYNLYERGIEEDVLPFCAENNIAVLTYGSICRGLLSGKITAETIFKEGDVRSMDPRFKPDNLKDYVRATSCLKEFAKSRGLTVTQLAIQWAVNKTCVTSALVGMRKAEQAKDNAGTFNSKLNEDDIKTIESIVNTEIPEPITRLFISPPRNLPKDKES